MNVQVRSRCRVAVLCGNADDGQAVRDVVAIEHPEVRVLVAAPDFGEALRLPDTDIVLLAQRDLQANRQALRALEAVPDGLDRRRTRIVLLSHKDEVREAYDLGRSRVVDDYVQYWPMALDGYRLRMCLLDQVRWLGEERAGRVPLVPERAAPAPAAPQAASRPQTPPFAPMPELPSLPIPGAGPLLLLVDDDPFLHKIMRRMVADSPVRLSCVASGHEAGQQIQRERPGVVLLDIHMPDMDGHEVLRRLQTHPATAGVPVVMLSGDSDREQVVQCLRLGAKGFVVKPFSKKTLFEALERHVPALALG
jgi:CheY-like chemotaxis protein